MERMAMHQSGKGCNPRIAQHIFDITKYISDLERDIKQLQEENDILRKENKEMKQRMPGSETTSAPRPAYSTSSDDPARICKKCGHGNYLGTLKENKHSPHYARLVCSVHGFVKWLPKPPQEDGMENRVQGTDYGDTDSMIPYGGLDE